MAQNRHLRRGEVYLDESLRRGRFDLYGGLWLPREVAQRLRTRISDLRARIGHNSEFKWTKASGSELRPEYREIANLTLDQLASGRARFNVFVVDRNKLDLRRFHDGDAELFYYKAFHLLLRQRIEPGFLYDVVMDRRSTRKPDRLATLRDVVNRAVSRDKGIRHWVINEIRPRASRDDDLLQATDVLLGAVGFHFSGGHRKAGASLAKCDLAERIAQKAGRASLSVPSLSPRDGPINVWLWRPSYPR